MKKRIVCFALSAIIAGVNFLVMVDILNSQIMGLEHSLENFWGVPLVFSIGFGFLSVILFVHNIGHDYHPNQ